MKTIKLAYKSKLVACKKVHDKPSQAGTMQGSMHVSLEKPRNHGEGDSRYDSKTKLSCITFQIEGFSLFGSLSIFN